MRYFTTERFFTGFSSRNMTRSEPVLRTEDLTDDECRALAESVQRELDELNRLSTVECYFELGPSADENLSEFIILKSTWEEHASKIDTTYGERGSCWQYDLFWLNSIAKGHLDVIRGLKRHSCPAVFLQCLLPDGKFSTFACVDSLTERELTVLEQVLTTELARIGTTLRTITDWHASKEPEEYVQAKIDFDRFAAHDSDANQISQDFEFELAAESAFDRCIEQVKNLRSMPAVLSKIDADESRTDIGSGDRFQSPSEELRTKYRDPDNYLRNVWLYEQRAAGMTNPAILAALDGRAGDFALLDSDNALRTAIESIAEFHGWPILKGRPGRPKANGAAAKSRSGNSETPQ
jgi:hypothetical protein